MEKRQRVILSSTQSDSDGDRMALEALQQMTDTINSNKKVRHSVDHNREFPPIGRLENAAIEEKDGKHYLTAEIVPFDKVIDVSWDRDLAISSFENRAPFVEIENEYSNVFKVSIDPHSFESPEKFQKFSKSINEFKDLDCVLAFSMRKSQLPDAEIIFTLTKSIFYYHLLKPTVKRIGEKIADKVSDKVVDKSEEYYKFFRETITNAIHNCIPRTRPVMIVFEIPGTPHIELFAKTKNTELVIMALQEKKIKKLRKEIESLSTKIDIGKIQFVLTEKGKWKFNYLLTEKGESLGRKVTIKKRDRRLNLIETGHRNKDQ